MQMTWDEFKKEVDRQLEKMGLGGDAVVHRIFVVNPRTGIDYNGLPTVSVDLGDEGIFIETDGFRE